MAVPLSAPSYKDKHAAPKPGCPPGKLWSGRQSCLLPPQFPKVAFQALPLITGSDHIHRQHGQEKFHRPVHTYRREKAKQKQDRVFERHGYVGDPRRLAQHAEGSQRDLLVGEDLRTAYRDLLFRPFHGICAHFCDVFPRDRVHPEAAVAEQEDPVFLRHPEKFTHVGKKSGRTDQAVVHTRTFQLPHEPLFSFHYFQPSKLIGVENKYVDEFLDPAFHGFLQQIHVSLVIHIHIGQPVFLTGDPDRDDDDLHILATAAEGLGARHFRPEDLIEAPFSF